MSHQALNKHHRLEVYSDQKLPEEYRERLERLTVGKKGIMWYRLQDFNKMHAMILFGKRKKIVAWAMLDKCVTEKRRVDLHVYVDKGHRGNSLGSFLRDEMFRLFGEQFNLFYYYDSKRKDFLKWPPRLSQSQF